MRHGFGQASRRWQPKGLYALLLAALSLAAPSHAESQGVSDAQEYKVKAAYLYNLTKFVNWPNGDAAISSASSARLCIYGNNPFSKEVEAALSQSRQAKNKPITVIHVSDPAEIARCHIAFVAASNKDIAKVLPPRDSKTQTLTVGENLEFLEMGGMIGLTLIEEKVMLQINLTLAKQAGFEISGNLLEVAKTIR